MPPCGGDPGWSDGYRRGDDFNPRPHTGATLRLLLGEWWEDISIHAPSRGRRRSLMIDDTDILFQSTPPRGGDRGLRDAVNLQPDFNPRPLAGATSCRIVLSLDSKISIHAPSRGRQEFIEWVAMLTDFNPRPLAGATFIPVVFHPNRPDFNPRPLAGATML